MSVYKLCLKLFKRDAPMMIIFGGLFIAMSILMAGSGASDERSSYSQVKAPLAFLSDDEHPLVEGLRQELGKVTLIIEGIEDEGALLDALFSGRAAAALHVPKGFSDSFLAGMEPRLELSPGRDDGAVRYVEMAASGYLSGLRAFLAAKPEIGFEGARALLDESFAAKAPVTIAIEGGGSSDPLPSKRFFNFLAYSLLAIIVMGIGNNLLAFEARGPRLRMACSPHSPASFGTRIFAANLGFAIVCWIAMSASCLAFIGELPCPATVGLFLTNSLALTVWAASMSFLVAQLVRTRDGINTVVNVLTLVTSFLSGVFVPREFLGEAVLRVSSLTPSYWYVLANERIASLASPNLATIAADPEFLPSLGMQLAFAASFLGVALALNKRRRRMA